MTTKLSDLQLVLLSAAAMRDDGSLLPLPDAVASQRSRIQKTLPALLKRSLITEAETTDAARTWREEQDLRTGLFITDAGRAAIGVVEPAAASETPADAPVAISPRPTKSAQVLSLLRRDQGATLAELVEATGWLPHTTRAALTGLRKQGHAIGKAKRDTTTCYHLVEAA